MRPCTLTIALLCTVFFLAGCNTKVIVSPTEEPAWDTEFAFVLAGVRYSGDDSLLSGWNFLWERTDPDVESNVWTGNDPNDLVWLSNFHFMAGQEKDGVQYFLRKVRPGHYAFDYSERVGSGKVILSSGGVKRYEFDAPRGQVTYIGTLTLGLHPQAPALVPYAVDDESTAAFRFLSENFSVGLPQRTQLATYDGLDGLKVGGK